MGVFISAQASCAEKKLFLFKNTAKWCLFSDGATDNGARNVGTRHY